MTTKLDRVFKAVIEAVGSNMTRYEAAEAAQYLLKKTSGDATRAVELAKTPFKIAGKDGVHFTY